MLPRMCTKLVKKLLLQHSVAICEERILRRYIGVSPRPSCAACFANIDMWYKVCIRVTHASTRVHLAGQGVAAATLCSHL